MIDISTVLDQIKEHAAEEAPSECCGLLVVVLGKLRYWKCRNRHKGQNGHFVIEVSDYAAAEDAGQVIAVVHSHVGVNPEPSQADLVGIERAGIPWVIVNHPTGSYTITAPTGYKAPLLGRVWAPGVLDCYSLARDYYQEKLGIALPEFEREDEWWKDPTQNLYRDHFKEAGFFEIRPEELREHDGILMAIGADRPNHGAVYIGDNRIIQHVRDRLSSRDVWGGWWQSVATHYVRHKDLA